MEFYLKYVPFHHMKDIKWIMSNIKFNSESIDGVVFTNTCTLPLLNLQFLALMNVVEKTRLPMDLELYFTLENVHFESVIWGKCT